MLVLADPNSAVLVPFLLKNFMRKAPAEPHDSQRHPPHPHPSIPPPRPDVLAGCHEPMNIHVFALLRLFSAPQNRFKIRTQDSEQHVRNGIPLTCFHLLPCDVLLVSFDVFLDRTSLRSNVVALQHPLDLLPPSFSGLATQKHALRRLLMIMYNQLHMHG